MKVSDTADAKVHVRGGWHGGHRVARGRGQDLAVVHSHPEHDGLRTGLSGSAWTIARSRSGSALGGELGAGWAATVSAAR